MAYPTITERYGSLSATGLAEEVTFGTPVTATTFLPMTGNTMESDPGWFSPTLMHGTRDKQVFNLYGEQQNIGSLDGALFPSNAIQLLVAAIGTDAVTGTVSPYCADEETEILTADGWKTLHQLNAGDEVLTYNHQTGMSEWQPVLEVCVFPAEQRELIRMKGRGHSSLTTPNHRWPVLRRWHMHEGYGPGAYGERRDWATTETLKVGDRIPIAAYCADLPGEAKYTDAFVELMAWFWTEGHIRPSGAVTLVQSMKNADNVERIHSVLRQLFGEPVERIGHDDFDRGRRGLTRKPDAIPRWRWYMDDDKVRWQLNVIAGDLLTFHAPGKVVDRQFLRSLTQAQLDLFIDISMRADNCGPTRLGQRKREMAEAFQFAAILAGHATSLLPRDYKRDGARMWHVTMRRNHRHIAPVNAARGKYSFSIDRVTHDGLVWCPRTPNQTWYARRDGTCYFTGNTHTISQANVLKSLTVEKDLGDYQSLQFAGARVNKLSVKAPVGNSPVSVTADMMAQSVAILTSPTAVSITNELPFVFAEASLTLYTHARAEVTNVQLDIDNGVKATWTYSGNHGPSFLTPVSLHVSGTIDVVWSSLNDSTYGDFSTMQNGTLGALSLAFTHPGMGGYSVTLNCPQVALSKVTSDIKFEDIILSSLAFEASKPLTGGSQYSIQAVVLNGASAGY